MDKQRSEASEGRSLRYDPTSAEAYCSFCRRLHCCWLLLPGAAMWRCQLCERDIADDAMQMNDRESDLEQIPWR